MRVVDTLVNRGDNLKAEKISIQARIIILKGEFRMTRGHNGHRAIAERNVLCVIEKEMVLSKKGSTPPS